MSIRDYTTNNIAETMGSSSNNPGRVIVPIVTIIRAVIKGWKWFRGRGLQTAKGNPTMEET